MCILINFYILYLQLPHIQDNCFKELITFRFPYRTELALGEYLPYVDIRGMVCPCSTNIVELAAMLLVLLKVCGQPIVKTVVSQVRLILQAEPLDLEFKNTPPEAKKHGTDSTFIVKYYTVWGEHSSQTNVLFILNNCLLLSLGH